jgi:hypothetical protein
VRLVAVAAGQRALQLGPRHPRIVEAHITAPPPRSPGHPCAA